MSDNDFRPATATDNEIYIGTRKYIATDRIEELEADLAKVKSERDKYESGWLEAEGRLSDAETRAETYRAAIPVAHKMALTACAKVRDTDQCGSGTSYDEGFKAAASWCYDEIEALADDLVEQALQKARGTA